MQLGGNGEHLPVKAANDVEPTVARGSGVIGMALEPGADLENLPALQRTLRQLVQAIKDADSNRRAAAESARRRDIARDRTRKGERPGASAFEERVPGPARHRRQPLPSPARNRDAIVNAQGNAEAVEARSEIRRARRDADGGLLHDSERSKAKRDAIVTGTA